MDSLKRVSTAYRDSLARENQHTFVADVFKAITNMGKTGLANPKSKEAFYQLKKSFLG